MKGKSIRYRDQGGLDIVEIDVPDPGHGEIQVQGGICGICAWDVYTFQHGAAAPSSAPPGHEAIGYVTKVGPDVVGIKEGDRVVGGGFGTVRNLRAGRIHRLPDAPAVPDEHWLVEPVSCVVTGVDHCDLHIGDRVAVVGCGFMGLLILQCLVNSFAQEVVALDVNPKRLALARKYGADRAINPADDVDALEALAADPVDVVVDASGSQAGLDTSVKVLRRGGRLNIFGWIHGPATMDGTVLHGGGYTIVSSSPSARVRDTFPVAIRLIEHGMVDLADLVTDVAPLEDISSLLEHAAQARSNGYIKGVVKLD